MVSKIGINILVGCVVFCLLWYKNIVMGKSVIDEVFNIRNRIWLLVRVFLCGVRFCMFCMVFILKGVVVLFRFNKFVDIFMVILLSVGWLWGMLGMIWYKNGVRSWENFWISFDFFVILKIFN